MNLKVIIVNYRTASCTLDCLRSLIAEVQTMEGADIVVVENGSHDGSAEQIQSAIEAEGWGSHASLLPLEANRGFSAGNNAALRRLLESATPPDYVLLLNPDTVVRPGAVKTLLEFMERHPGIGIAGSRLEDPDGTPQRSAFRFPTVFSEVEGGVRLGIISKLLHNSLLAPPAQDHAHPTDWLAGASMLVRRAVFESVGLMDENYFLYFEEVDFCLAARRAGWPCWYVPLSRVIHLVGQSSGVTDTRRPARRVPRYWFESRRRFFVKNHGRLYNLLADVGWAAGFALWRVRRWLQRKPDRDPPGLLWDFIRYNFLTPELPW
jgi:N-acetylglucosaminyl-diphospho-decaprenol L-rhamnosyltransferase